MIEKFFFFIIVFVSCGTLSSKPQPAANIKLLHLYHCPPISENAFAPGLEMGRSMDRCAKSLLIWAIPHPQASNSGCYYALPNAHKENPDFEDYTRSYRLTPHSITIKNIEKAFGGKITQYYFNFLAYSLGFDAFASFLAIKIMVDYINFDKVNSSDLKTDLPQVNAPMPKVNVSIPRIITKQAILFFGIFSAISYIYLYFSRHPTIIQNPLKDEFLHVGSKQIPIYLNDTLAYQPRDSDAPFVYNDILKFLTTNRLQNPVCPTAEEAAKIMGQILKT